jgi:hypothetical protein
MKERQACWRGECGAMRAVRVGQADPAGLALLLLDRRAGEIPRRAAVVNQAVLVALAVAETSAVEAAGTCSKSWIVRHNYRWPI